MAKFIIEYEIHIGDKVQFKKSDGELQFGIVQDISQLPDVFVEGFEDDKYKRWCMGVNSLKILDSEHTYGESCRVEVDTNEYISYTHKGVDGTQEFSELQYTTYK